MVRQSRAPTEEVRLPRIEYLRTLELVYRVTTTVPLGTLVLNPTPVTCRVPRKKRVAYS